MVVVVGEVSDHHHHHHHLAVAAVVGRSSALELFGFSAAAGAAEV